MQISNNYNSGNFFSTDLNFKSKKPNLVILKNSRSMKEIAAELIEKKKKNLDLDKNILQKLLMGFSIKELAEKFGVSVYRVNEISAKYQAHKIYIQRRNDIILEKLKNGVSRKTIMKEMDVSKRTVQVVAEANNAFAEKVKERDALIIEKLKTGMNGKDIAKELGISEATVMRAAQKLGLSVSDLKKLAKD